VTHSSRQSRSSLVPRLYVLVLSGGAGTRLWPLSRRDRPKQFLNLLGDRTLLQDTIDRVAEFVPNERIFVVAPPEHRALIHEQLPELAVDHLVVEPYPRGNAAAIGLAMAALAAFDPEAVVAVLPSDHVVGDRGQFRKVLIAATAAADRGHLVTLGITPERADTGFGYIEAGDRLEVEGPVEVRAVKRFVEKPKRDAAERMVAAGGHFWNAGMFVWRVEEILRAYEKHLPRTAKALDALREAIGSPRYESVLAEVWEETDRTTVDYGIAEKAQNVAVVPANIGWQDVGSWARLSEIVSKADNWASGDVVAEDAHDNYVWSPGKTVALIGVEGLVVVDTPDALLVTTKERSEDVKTVVDRLTRENGDQLL
jgi:mannose-1-phosphate guanylyltransferase